MGLVIYGSNDIVSRVHSHHHISNGVLITGSSNNSVVEDSEVNDNCEYNKGGSGGHWASGLTAARRPTNAIMRRNRVYNNWGEGLSTYEANGTIMEDNIVYNNYSTNVYISDVQNTITQRNLVYATPDSPVQSGARVGIMMGDEKANPMSQNNTIINNFVYGTQRNFYWWLGASQGLINVTIANNTFVNSTAYYGVQINSGSHQNSRFSNNIIIQENSLPIALISAGSGVIISNNLWSKSPSVSGTGDIVANPLISRTGSYTSPDWFKLTSGSPAINKAMVLSAVTVDYFKNARGSAPDIGAHEYGGGGPPPPTPTVSAGKPGDANSDDRVDGLDYVVWLNHFNQTTSSGPAAGDFNRSGKVDGLDYVVWLNNFGT